MKIAIPRETAPGERRVSLTPDVVARLVNSGMEVIVESGAGEAASFPDGSYEKAGAAIGFDASALYGLADVVLKVQKPSMGEVELMKEGSLLIAFLQPLTSPDLVRCLSNSRVTGLSMDSIPRIARAQAMDALTSMASIAGYKAALIAANSLGKFFPMMITAAGTIAPAKGLVLGAGVAGLQAIATARRLGAVMYAYDVRPVVKEQVQSLGARFIEAEAVADETEQAGGYARELAEDAQSKVRDLVHRHIRDMDFVVTTAAVPGRPAPLLVTENMVADMRPGAVIIDIAAETGGNCELTRPGAEIVAHGVAIHGPLNLPSLMAPHASQMYSRNISALLLHIVKEGEIRLDFDDEIVSNCCITHEGRIVRGPIKDTSGA